MNFRSLTRRPVRLVVGVAPFLVLMGVLAVVPTWARYMILGLLFSAWVAFVVRLNWAFFLANPLVGHSRTAQASDRSEEKTA